MQDRVIRRQQKRVVRRFASAIALVALTACLIPGAAMAAMGGTTFAGTWATTYGLMTLEQKEKVVTGHYLIGGGQVRTISAADVEPGCRSQTPKNPGLASAI